MRLIDLLQPYLAGVSTIVDIHTGGLDLRRHLRLPDGVTYERRAPSELPRESLGEDSLVTVITGPDPRQHGDPDDAVRALRSLRAGGRAAILFGHPETDLPYHRLLGELSQRRCQVLQVAVLEYEHIHSAAVIARVDHLEMPRGPAGQPIGPEAAGRDQLGVALRIANEYAFGDFASRAVRIQLREWEQQRQGAEGDQARRRGELDARVAEIEGQLRKAEAVAARLEASTSYRLGRSLVRAAHSPGRAAKVPGDLFRLWQTRGVANRATARVLPARRASPAKRRPSPSPELTLPTDQSARFLAHSAVAIGPRSRLVVAGIIRDDTAATLAPDVVVDRMNPNDARLVLERTDPDLVLVETAAFAAGQPWAFAGNPAALERDMELAEILRRARVLGRPAVLLRDASAVGAIGTVHLEPAFDLLLDVEGPADGAAGWSAGVQLARFNALDASAERAGRPLFLGAWDQRAPLGQRRFLEEALADAATEGLEIRLDPWDTNGAEAFPDRLRAAVAGRATQGDLPALYGSRAVLLASPFTSSALDGTVGRRILEQLACGGRVISARNERLRAVLGSYVTFVDEPGATGAAVRGAQAAGPRDRPEKRALLDALFLRHATPVMLDDLLRRLGLKADPLRGRSVAIVASLGAHLDRGALADSVLCQRHAPREVILVAGEGTDPTAGGLDALAGAGITVRVVPGGDDRPVLRAAAEQATSHWLTDWSGPDRRDERFLLDLVIGGEISRADAVGYVERDGDRFVPRLEAPRSIFGREELLDPTLTLPPTGSRDTALEDWSRRGRRLFGVEPAAAAADEA